MNIGVEIPPPVCKSRGESTGLAELTAWGAAPGRVDDPKTPCHPLFIGVSQLSHFSRLYSRRLSTKRIRSQPKTKMQGETVCHSGKSPRAAQSFQTRLLKQRL